ncbi:isovaleryl-CoA dehydrogenase [Planctomycetota bacterium]|nr:isovaleryl-CoA dehydrogenase [Planctomycetota bacterium]
MHNLELTDDQAAILETIKKLVQGVVAPNVLALDEHRQFAQEGLQGLAELGLFGMSVPEVSFGAGMGLVPLVAGCEEIGGQSGSLARLLTAQVQCGIALARAGSGPLEDVLTGGKRAVYLGPEFGIVAVGSSLSGFCELVPGAGEADLFVIAARGDGAGLYVVDAGKTTRTVCQSLGLASTAPARVVLSGAQGALMASGVDAMVAIESADVAGWIAGAATCVGMGRASLQLARKHSSERFAFGKPLLAQQAVARKLVESQRGLDAARHLAYHAARIHDAQGDAVPVAMAARIAATEAAVHAADEAIQIHGGYGYTVEYHVERHYRDAKTIEVLDGGNELLKDRLAAQQFAG